MEFLRQHQLNFMLVFIGICGILILFTLITKIISPKRKFCMVLMEAAAMLLLTADRFAYIYRGDISTLGFYMVRISNFLVFSMSILCIHAFNLYLGDLLTHEGKMKKVPKALYIPEIFFMLGEILVIVSQFNNMYYYFDEMNRYHRGPYIMLSYVAPMGSLFIQLCVIIKNFKRLSKLVSIPIILFTLLPVVATVIQIFSYGISLTNLTITGQTIVIYIFTLVTMNNTVEKANKCEMEVLKDEQKNIQLMFEQTAMALASAIDAKDKYTHGHSRRVAEYSRKIAELAGKTPKECEDVYFAGLLHDVGKIGIPDTIINKEGKLTTEEFAAIKQHPVIGNQILSQIAKSPYLSIGAHYHHERFDGKGYPEGLKGDDIPEIARIIAVADSYDAMTSKRSYREPIPQQKVREEIVKGIETQFDPQFAKIMIHLIDLDIEYKMKEQGEIKELSGKNELYCSDYRSQTSEGIFINDTPTRITLRFTTNMENASVKHIPSFILFDALDERVHDDEIKKKEMSYFEYGEVHFDGNINCEGARKIITQTLDERSSDADLLKEYTFGLDYDIEAVRVFDHALLTIKNKFKTMVVTVALPDSIRFLYLALTGEQCHIDNVTITKSEKPVEESYIPRIAERVSYIKDAPTGDIPNVQVDGWCASSTPGILIDDELEISFHAMTLPTARLVWHCPYVSLFHSDDGIRGGKNFKEFSLLRFDGESWETDDKTKTHIYATKNDQFVNWDTWKAKNKIGMDCVVFIKRDGNKITMYTENNGIEMRSVTTIKELEENGTAVYVALTGDQCALTNIKVHKKNGRPRTNSF